MSNKYLRIVAAPSGCPNLDPTKINALVGLAQSEATLVVAGISSALPHYIAIVKELEEVLGFKFEKVDLND